MDNLKELYVDQMRDIYSACKQSRDITIELEKASSHDSLKAALHAGHQGISSGMTALEELIRGHGAEPGGEHCRGMEGLVKEARAHALEGTFGDDAVRDAMIITQYQRMAHYAIAGYGCIKAFATRLELLNEAEKIDELLSATYDGDDTMTSLALGGINADAA